MDHCRLRRPKARLLGYVLVLAVVCSAILSGQRPQARAATAFRYGEALQKSILFYEAQQSGKLPSWNRVSWRADATTTDGQAEGVDLSGGWYDAGDHVKFGFPMAFATSMLAWGVVENRDGYVQSGQLTHILNNLRWANDYFISAHPAPNVLYGHVGDVQADHNFWGPPEMIALKGIPRPAYKITSSCPGTDLAAETAAAMAASSIAFREADPAYADTLLTHAKQLFTFADTTKSADGQASSYINCITVAKDFYNALGEGGWGNPAATKNFWDELVWSAIWLYRATGDTTYLTYARTLYPKMGSQPEPGQGGGTAGVPVYTFGLGWNDKEYANYALMAKLTGEQQYKDDTQRYLDYWTVGYKGTKGKITPGGLAFIFYWASLRMAANTAFVALTYADYLGPDHPLYARYHDFGKRQIDYALGDNPLNRSFMVGFGNNPPLNVHHRGAHGAWQGYMAPEPVNNRHVLTGALAGGPDETDAYADSRTDYVRNEVAVDFNAGITSSLARLYREYGGAPLAAFPVRETPDFEIYAEGSVSQSDSRSSSIQVFITNQSAWPPRVVDKGKIRYFFTLDGTTTPAQISVAPSGQSSCPVSGPTQWAGQVYYVTADCTGVKVYPGDMQTYRKSTQFTITSSGSWDPTNDYSYQDIAGAGWSGVKTSKILIDNGAVREWGTPPPGGATATPTPTSTPTRTPTATPGNLPDLTITSMWIGSQSSGCSQGPLGLWVRVANIGTAAAGPFSVGANGATQTVAGLAAGQQISVWLASNVFGNTHSAAVDTANQVAESNEENNQRVELLPIPTPLPCTTPTFTPTPTATPATPTPGGKVVIEGHIRLGSSTGPGLSGVNVAIFFGSPHSQVQTDADGYYRVELPVPLNQESTSVTPSAPGYVFSPSSYAWIILRSGAGTYTRDFVATSTTPVPTSTPTPVSLPDLTITSIELMPQSLSCPYGPLGLKVWVKNIGSADAGPFVVTGNNTTQTVAGLAAGQQTSVWFSTYTISGINTATVDSANQVAESDESNNQRSGSLMPPPLAVCPQTPTPPTVTPPTPTNTPTPTPTPGASTLKVQYRAADTSAGDNQIKPHFTIVNTGAGAVPLSELKLRYWYTVDGDKAQTFWCDYAVVGCANVKGTFVKLAAPRTGADYYVEVSFTGTGSIAAGGRSGEIQARLSKSDWSNYSETGDYSYDPTKTAFADWSKVTLYRNGVLVWGTEP